MCNRYRIKGVMEADAYVWRLFNLKLRLERPRWNIAPNQLLPIIVTDEAAKRTATVASWNLVPFYEKASRPSYLRTNARSEEVLGKASYREGIQKRRCLVPADGFYEWEHFDGGKIKIPWAFELEDARPFSFAGIWEPGTATRPPSFTILTTSPNTLVGRIHNRMPVVLDEPAAERWIDQGEMTPDRLQHFVQPFPAGAMRSYRVEQALNSVRNDTPEAAAPFVEVQSAPSAQGELFS